MPERRADPVTGWGSVRQIGDDLGYGAGDAHGKTDGNGDKSRNIDGRTRNAAPDATGRGDVLDTAAQHPGAADAQRRRPLPGNRFGGGSRRAIRAMKHCQGRRRPAAGRWGGKRGLRRAAGRGARACANPTAGRGVAAYRGCDFRITARRAEAIATVTRMGGDRLRAPVGAAD